MKTKLFNIALFGLLSVGQIFAQDVTTVRANNNDISDNLDLQAVASIFGDSRDLEDFERRLNDPSTQISNLDLNGDNRVDYLRVIEATEGNTHLIILQSVLAADTFQDVATIEVERDRSNNVRVQVVGDVYMYGPNYIYEPIYVSRPYIYDVFWVNSYRPYYSPWYWGYYPTYYSYWSPYPIYRYRNNVHLHINHHHHYNYVNTRYSTRAVALHNTRRANGYERQHPDRSFTRRTNATNRYALEQTRSAGRADAAGRSATSTRNSAGRVSEGRSTNGVPSTNINNARINGTAPVRSSLNATPANTRQSATTSTRSNTDAAATRSNSNVVRSNPAATTTRSNTMQPARQSTTTRSSAPAVRSNPAPSVRQSSPAPSVRQSAPAMRQSAPTMRQSAPAPSRQSAPAPSRSASGGRSSRG
jgi:hypothetical protein